MNITKLIKKSSKGLIPGPNESYSCFMQRCDRLEKKTDSTSIPLLPTQFDCSPHWVTIKTEKHNLCFWHGAYTEITYDKEEKILDCQIFIPDLCWPFTKIYSKEEILHHELAHVGRIAFEEPLFEEILAYHTSGSSYRRWLGPFMHELTPWTPLAAPLLFLATAFFSISLFALFFSFLFLLAIRYQYRFQTFHKALAKITDTVGEKNALAAIYRMTDQEITTIAAHKGPLFPFITTLGQDLRWKIITHYLYPL